MSKDEVLMVLRHREKEPVDLAVSLVNLSYYEEIVLFLCGRKGLTQKEVAEKYLDRSEDAVQRWWSSGLKKLQQTWSGMQWVRNMILSGL